MPPSPGKLLLLSLLLVQLITSTLGKYDFCEKKCKLRGGAGESEQYACRCEFAEDCEIPDDIDWPEFRQTMLDAHNEFRNRFATGSTAVEKGKNMTGAADMMAMTYDYDLEYTARCHTKRCVFGHACGITEKFGKGGQNLATHSAKMRDLDKMANFAMDGWYSQEIINVTPEMLQILQTKYDSMALQKLLAAVGPNAQIGHFTQMVWAKTASVGCWFTHGMITLYEDANKLTGSVPTKFRLLLTCNYGPAGNMQGTPMYKAGAPASACPAGTQPNEEYKGLCGKDVLPDPPSPGSKYGYDDPSASFDSRRLRGVWVVLVFGSMVVQILLG